MSKDPATSNFGARKKRTKYEEIADRLREKVLRGDFSHKLPGTRYLSKELDTNAMTLSSAVKVLVNEGILYRVPKSGTYVKKKAEKNFGTIALLVSTEHAPMTHKAMTAITMKSHEVNIDLQVMYHGKDPKIELKYLKQLCFEKRVDGVLWWPSYPHYGAQYQEHFDQAKIPYVAIFTSWLDMSGVSVGTDQFHGFQCLTNHLIEQGYKKIACVGHGGLGENDAKYLAYRSAMEKAGLEVQPSCYISMDELNARTPESKRKVAETLSPHEAIICQEDRFAVRVYQTLSDKGIKCPADIAIASYDGLEIAEVCDLTTYSQPMERIGEISMEILLNWIQEPDQQPHNVFEKGELLVRSSTSKP